MPDPAARIGFMQGRLSAPVEGRIQAFPWRDWRLEFERAKSCGFAFVEWTLDQDRLRQNPLMTEAGRREIAELTKTHGVRVASITGDCFMQAPFWKARAVGAKRDLVEQLVAVCDAAAKVGAGVVVVPLVDAGRLENHAQEDDVANTLGGLTTRLATTVAFEIDYAPFDAERFIKRLPASRFGINYDIGNSAALGFDPVQEITSYGPRIVNVHVKDRKFGGTTVPLGTGDADLPGTIRRLERGGYRGNYVLQTARAADGDDVGAAQRYREMTLRWIAAGAGSG
jgi:hexulose-6-phosphate isomerase